MTPLQTALKPAPDGDFERKWKAALDGNNSVSAGQICLIGLERIRAHFGADWPRLEHKILAIIRREIERRLSPLDMYECIDVAKHVIVFGGLPPLEAQLKSALIAREVTRAVLGNDWSPGFTEVSAIAAKVNGEVQIKEVVGVDLLWEAIERHNREQAAAAAAKAAESDSGIERVRPRLIHVFRPLWFVKNRILNSNLCQPAVVERDGRMTVGYDVLPDAEEHESTLELDILTLERVAQESGPHSGITIMPVHFESLANMGRRFKFLRVAQGLQRNRHMENVVFELVGLPDGVAQSRLLDVLSALRKPARAVMAQLDVRSPPTQALAQAGFHAVGIDVTRRVGTEQETLEHMNRFVAAAGKLNLHTYCHGLSSNSMTIGAIYAGFDYINSGAVARLSDTPREARPFQLEDLYKTVLS